MFGISILLSSWVMASSEPRVSALIIRGKLVWSVWSTFIPKVFVGIGVVANCIASSLVLKLLNSDPTMGILFQPAILTGVEKLASSKIPFFVSIILIAVQAPVVATN